MVVNKRAGVLRLLYGCRITALMWYLAGPHIIQCAVRHQRPAT
jgi:hypothetical protein